MSNQYKNQHFALFYAFLFFFVPTQLSAQSLSDLEKELLLDTTEAPAQNTQQPTPVQTRDASAGDLLESFAEEASKDAEDFVYSDEEKEEVESSALEDIDEAISGPKQIPFDHILVVKHRYVTKEGRWEMAPITVGIQPADSFRKQIGIGFSLAYHLSETFALEALHTSFTTNYRSALEANINNAADNDIGFSRVEPVVTLGSAIWWSPFKGKSATVENTYHWEAALIAGGGMTRTEEAFVGMGMFGAAARLHLNKRAILKFELRDYYDFTANGDHRVNLIAGASVLFGED